MEQNQQETKSNSSTLLAGAIMVAALIVAGALVYSTGSKSINSSGQAPGQPANVANTQNALPPIGGRDAVLGNPKAPVALIEYGDYQCPFCGRFFNQVEPSLREDYIKTGKVKMVFRNFQFLGAESTAAAAAAECAKDQGKFWAFHDQLYKAETDDSQENNGNLNRDLFLALAKNINIDDTAFTACVDGNKYIEQVQQDTGAAQALGVSGTPTTYVNGEKIVGAQPYSVYKAAIEAALKSGK